MKLVSCFSRESHFEECIIGVLPTRWGASFQGESVIKYLHLWKSITNGGGCSLDMLARHHKEATFAVHLDGCLFMPLSTDHHFLSRTAPFRRSVGLFWQESTDNHMNAFPALR